MTACRTFSESEEQQRDAWIHDRVENDCDGCEPIYDTVVSDVGFRPHEHCPVHGVDSDAWWHELNVELDKRWPGTWHEGVQA